MAPREAAALLPLAESIADGTPIDWDAAEASAASDDRAIIRQLRILSNLAALHHSLPAAPEDSAPATIGRRPMAAPAIGSWAHLALVERLGGGTFGEVYRAWDRHLEREVALKLLRSDEASPEDPEASRIMIEGRLLARIRHQNVITVHGVAVHERRVGLWMELVRGATLEQVLQTHGPFSAREAAGVGIDLCRALAAIHAAGLIHRDVKAQNVMREDGGRIVLMDLGTSREITPAGRQPLSDMAGTPLYLAPEIFDQAPASERSDLYSLGVLLYHLVTGTFPVRATTVAELQAGHAGGTAVRLRDVRADLPTGFVRVVERAMAREPERRYASAGALEADLVHALDDRGEAPRRAMSSADATAAVPARLAWRRAGVLAALCAATVALVVLGAWALRVNRAPAAPVVPATIRSIAVLPLTNLTGDNAQEYFADGITDELISRLGQLGNLTVISRTSVMRFKGSKQPLPEIAQLLHVDAVLESSVKLMPGAAAGGPGGSTRVRINARLYAGSDAPLWAEDFEEVVADLFALQGRVAKRVADGIGMRLTSQQQGTLTRSGRENVDAQDAYLQGHALLNRRSRDRVLKARDYLERAVQIDPGYARAYASLAQCYTSLGYYGLLSRREAAQLTLEAAATAVRLDAAEPDAHNELAGAAFIFQWDWATAEREYRRAIELNPSYSLARSDYARFLMAQDRLDEALAQARIAEAHDPLSAEASGVVALALYYQRKYDESISARRHALQLDPESADQYLGLGRAYEEKGAFDEAIAALEWAVTLSGRAPFRLAELARAYAVSGRRQEAETLMASLKAGDVANGTHLPAQYQAYVSAALGDYDRAFEHLAIAFAAREPSVLWTRVDPRVDSLRGDERFEPFVRQLPPRPAGLQP